MRDPDVQLTEADRVTVRYLGIEVDDALSLSEQTEIGGLAPAIRGIVSDQSAAGMIPINRHGGRLAAGCAIARREPRRSKAEAHVGR